MKQIISFSIVILLLASACKKQKDLPQPEVNDPHFYVKCSMDGKPLSIEAGNDDYYMNASWYHQDSNNVYVYKANLAKQNSSGYQVTILLNETKTASASDPMHVDSTLIIGDRLYNDLIINGTQQTVKFTPVRGVSNSDTYFWSYTDGKDTWGPSGGMGSGYYPYSKTLDVGKTYSVTLKYGNADGSCSQTFTNVYRVGSKMQTAISATRMSSSEFKYQFSYSPVDPMYTSLKCTWQFSSGGTYMVSSPIKILQPNATDRVMLILSDSGTGDSCISYYQINATDNPVCEANFQAEFSKIVNTRMPSSVTILLTDPNGVVYSSQAINQPGSSNFQISEVAEYTANEKGQPTKSLKVKFNCIVKNGSNQINLTNGEAKVAVAYK